MSIGILAPNALGGIAKLFDLTGEEQRKRYNYLWRGFHELRRTHAFEFRREENGYQVYRPTFLGMKRIKKLIFDELVLAQPKRWDGQWRLVIFDIPKNLHQKRNALRRKLKELGFLQCQKSVWIHPFPCIEEVEFLKNLLRIKPYVKIFLVSEMTDGKVLYNFRVLLKKTV